MKKYISLSTGNELVRKEGMFHWRGRFFSGLVDEEVKALYDNPEDSFAAHIGIESAPGEGLIEEISISEEEE